MHRRPKISKIRLKRPKRNNLFCKTMRRMFSMLKRMAVWAQNFKIVKIVVFTVSVFVMHAKNFRMLTVPTPDTTGQHSAINHFFTYSSKFRQPNFFGRFVDAGHATIFTFSRWRSKKFSFAMCAFATYRSFLAHGFVVTFWRTVFSFICSACNVRKFCLAHRAIRCQLQS